MTDEEMAIEELKDWRWGRNPKTYPINHGPHLAEIAEGMFIADPAYVNMDDLASYKIGGLIRTHSPPPKWLADGIAYWNKTLAKEMRKKETGDE